MTRNRPDVPYIKKQSEIDLLEISCRIVAEALTLVGKYVKPGIETIELDKIAEDYIRSKNAVPAFKGQKVDDKVFPGTLCISIDEEVVHGIPGNRKLKEGEIVSIDCGALINGYYGDSAVTFPVGEISEEKQKLLRITEESLFKGIQAAVPRNKVYDISKAVQEYVEQFGYSVTRELVGHGIGTQLWEEPPIPNFVPPLLYRSRYPNMKLAKGNALAIEPMVHIGEKEVYTDADGWTIRTRDHSPAAHFEHTIIVDVEPIILTLRS